MRALRTIISVQRPTSRRVRDEARGGGDERRAEPRATLARVEVGMVNWVTMVLDGQVERLKVDECSCSSECCAFHERNPRLVPGWAHIEANTGKIRLTN
eukprot:3723199-Prymnesium_polylepis.2